jgi:hypothetical protein
VPWWALLALGLLVAGVVLVAIKGPAAASAAKDMLAAVGGSTSSGFPKYMSVYSSSMWASVGVAGAAALLLAVGASVRLDQRLRKAGKYSTPKGERRRAGAHCLLPGRLLQLSHTLTKGGGEAVVLAGQRLLVGRRYLSQAATAPPSTSSTPCWTGWAWPCAPCWRCGWCEF